MLISCQKSFKNLDLYQEFKEGYRGSNVRGVSKNGRQNWQILSMN
jgi:hypothetical protein